MSGVATVATRGSTFIFTATFFDVNGNIINPAGATLYVSYRVNQTLVTDTVVMAPDINSTWTASWDSSVADGGRTDWHIRSAGSNKAAMEGALLLQVNLANPPLID